MWRREGNKGKGWVNGIAALSRLDTIRRMCRTFGEIQNLSILGQIPVVLTPRSN